MKWNEAQERVINHKEGAAMVVAGAGSGKTAVTVNRIKKLIDEGKKNIIAITFTRNSANDLKKKLADLGIEKGVLVGTFHAVCGRILSLEGLYKSDKIKIYEVENIFNKLYPQDKVDVEAVLGFISYQKAYMRSYDDDFVYKETDYDELELRMFYKAYEDYKEQKNLMDLDDVLLKAYEVLKTQQNAYRCDYILVDEAQDCNLIQNKLAHLLCPSGNIMYVGDYRQCLLPNTLIKTVDGDKEIKDIISTDKLIVGSGRGKTTITDIEDIMVKEYDGDIINIKTKSGHEIQCTPNHMIFVDRTINAEYCIYLMYKPEYGFRIGQSTQYKKYQNNKGVKNGFEARLTSEVGERIWCIRTCDTQAEATFYENYYAFEYGIPLYIFNEKSRNVVLKQDEILRLFNSIDTRSRGLKLLSDLNMYFDYPHYMPQGNSQYVNVKVNLNMFGSSRYSKGINNNYIGYKHELNFCTINSNFTEKARDLFQGTGITEKTNGNGFKYYLGRKTNGYHDELHKLGSELTTLEDKVYLTINATITKTCEKMDLFPASNIRKGMLLAIYVDGELISDEVSEISTERYTGKVYDINVPMYRNYIANNIAVHNCLYSFRGAVPQMFMDFDKRYPGAEIINLDYNYRSRQQIVSNANYFISQYYGNYEHYSDSIPSSTEDANIDWEVSITQEDEAVFLLEKIQGYLAEGIQPNEIAVLYRNNVQSQHLENELVFNGIDYYIEKNGGFFQRKEINIILCMLRLLVNSEDNAAYETLITSRIHYFQYFKGTFMTQLRETAGKLNTSYMDAAESVPGLQRWQIKNILQFNEAIRRLTQQYHQEVSLARIIDNIINILSLDAYLENKYKGEDLDERRESVQNFKKFIKNNTVDSFLKFVYEVDHNNKKNDENKIQLMTIHKSKGLEFKKVIVMGIQEGKFPSSKEMDITGEARLFYVAVTRPKEELVLSQVGLSNTFCDQYNGL